MKFKSLLLMFFALPLWVLHDPAVDTVDAGSGNPSYFSEEKPFVLLATVHNYGYVEPCG